MDQIVSYLVTSLVTVLLIAVIILSRAGLTVLKNKANLAFDEARNIKIEAITKALFEHVDNAIEAYIIENDITELNSDNLVEVIKGVSEKVKTLTGQGVIKFLMDTFVDNWDDWIFEVILSRINKV